MPRSSLIPLCAALLLASLLHSPAHARLRPGLEIGVNGTSLHYDDPGFEPWHRFDWRVACTGGLSLEVPLADRFAVVTGLRYLRVGNRIELGNGLVGEVRFTQDYLSIPALVKIRPLPLRRLFVLAGPEAAVLLSGRGVSDYRYGAGGFTCHVTQQKSITRYLRAASLFMDGGCGWEFPLQTHTGVVTARYVLGLTDLAREAGWRSNWTTRGVEGLLGIEW